MTARSTRAALRLLAVAMLALPLLGTIARAELVEDFYKGRSVQLVVGYGPGGGYDVYAEARRASHRKHFRNREHRGAEHARCGQPGGDEFAYNTAPKDGSVFGIFARDMAMMGVLGGNANARFDPEKFTWLGTPASAANDAYLMIARKDLKIRTIEDARKPGGPALVLGGTGQGTGGNDWAIMLRDTIPLNIKLIPGYPDSAAMFLAIERKEIDGRSLDYSSLKSSRPDWLKADSPVHVILQFGRRTRHPDFPDVPTALELAPNDKVRALIEMAELSNTLSRPFAAPPGIPEDRAKALQAAFKAMCADPEFRAEAEKLRVDVSPLDAGEVMDVIHKIAATPKDVRDQMRKIRYDSKKKKKGG